VKGNQLIFFNLDPVTGQTDEIARVPNYEAKQPHFSLSPDGTRIVIADTQEENGKVRILSLRTGQITALRIQGWKWQALYSVGWAANGKDLFAVALSQSSAALISIAASGRSKVLYNVDLEQASLATPLASPDGRLLAFAQPTYVSDLVMLENF
jgi:Tol biopolymer transport system component